MFSYYGSKSKIVGCYPYPKYDKIIEPFAGSARYSLKHFEKDILLIDKYDVIIKIWHYLQAASERDIMSLPEPKLGEKIKKEDYGCEEELLLMGFLVQQGAFSPGLTVSSYAENNIRTQKKNIAQQLFKIKHWIIKRGDYKETPNMEATWFVDPPYEFGGYKYKHNKIDYKHLAKWCGGRMGQVIVCENEKASWLPFKQMAKMTGKNNITKIELIWSNQQTVYDNEQLSLYAIKIEDI